MRLLPFFIMSQPVKGMAITAPIEVDKSTRPSLLLLRLNKSCNLGSLEARFACINPLIKKIAFTANLLLIIGYRVKKE